MLEVKGRSKGELRPYFKQVRGEISARHKQQWDHLICERLASLSEFHKASQLLVYVSTPIEVGTDSIISDSFGNKQVLCPRCVSGTNLMDFFEIHGFDDLEKGYFGIREPREGLRKVTEFQDSAVCIVPALAFDLRGYRLGYGKGFYDRFLSENRLLKIGLCYDNCICDRLENDEFDINCDIVITDKRIIKIGKEKS